LPAKVALFAAVLDARAAGRKVTASSGHSHYDLHIDDIVPAAARPLARRLGAYAADVT
jgi:hypothetical protein